MLKTSDAAPYKTGEDFGVLISCETATAARAFEVLELLDKNLKREPGRLLYQVWNVEALAFRELRELGAVEAALADVIILGLRAGRELSAAVGAWMRRCLDLRNGRPGALVVVLEADPRRADVPPELLSQLKAAAAAGQMDFFVTEAKVGNGVGRDDGMVRGAGAVARQFVLAHQKGGVSSGLPGGRRMPAEAGGG